MNQEITTFEGKKPILMKSGLVHWISPETWDKISGVLASQSGHQFIRISELGGITINTAEVEGAYTAEQYADILKIKQGMYQCIYKQWHQKRDTCDCARELEKKRKHDKEEKERQEDSKPRTPEEQAQLAETLRRNREILEARGVLGKSKRVQLKT